MTERAPSGEQADGKSRHPDGYHRYLKKSKLRKERRRARQNPECLPCYRKYRGYET